MLIPSLMLEVAWMISISPKFNLFEALLMLYEMLFTFNAEIWEINPLERAVYDILNILSAKIKIIKWTGNITE